MNKAVTVTDENGNKHEISALADEMLTEMYLRAKKAEEQRDDARRQAATYAAHIEDLSDQIDLWRERALVARRKYHETRHERDDAVDALYKTVKQYTENGYINGHAITRAEKLTGKATDG